MSSSNSDVRNYPTITIDKANFGKFRKSISTDGQLKLRAGGGTTPLAQPPENFYSGISFLFQNDVDLGYPPGCATPDPNPSGNQDVIIDGPTITVIIANGLDAPLKLTTQLEHGDLTGQPAWTHFDPGSGRANTTINQVPGYDVPIQSKKFGIPITQQEHDMPTLGIGVFTFKSASFSLFGVGGGIQIESDDTDFKGSTPAIRFYKGYGGSGDYASLVEDPSAYGGFAKFADDADDTSINVPWSASKQIKKNAGSSAPQGKTKVQIDLNVNAIYLPEINSGFPVGTSTVYGLVITKDYY